MNPADYCLIYKFFVVVLVVHGDTLEVDEMNILCTDFIMSGENSRNKLMGAVWVCNDSEPRDIS